MPTGLDIIHLPTEQLINKLSQLSEHDIEELLQVTEPWRTSHESRFDLYEPTKVARYFHESSAHIRGVFGANRSSKTLGNIVDDIATYLGRPPKSMESTWSKSRIFNRPTWGRVIGVDYPNGIEKILIPMFKLWCPPSECRDYDKELRMFTSTHGSHIEFMSYEMDDSKFAGVARDYVHFDEEPSRYKIWEENVKRVASTGGYLTLSMTPEKGITWTYNEIYARARKRYESVSLYKDNKFTRNREILIRENPSSTFSIETFHSTIYDNQYIPDAQIKQFYDDIVTDKRRYIALLGEFISNTGLVYDEFNTTFHVIDAKKINLPAEYPRFMSVDPGLRIPWAMLVVCILPNGMKVIEESEYIGNKPQEFTAGIQRALDKEVLNKNGKLEKRWFVFKIIDPQVNQPDPLHPKTLMEYLNTSPYNFCFRNASKEKELGISLVQKALHYSVEENTQPELIALSTCHNWINEMSNYEWEEWSSKVRDDKDAKQKPKDKNDHFPECTYRVFLEHQFRFIDKSLLSKSLYNKNWRKY